MLTPDDKRKDGEFTDYLNNPEKWKKYNPLLFNFIKHSLNNNKSRCVSQAERGGIIQNCLFFSKQLLDDSGKRQQYFSEMGEYFDGVDLIFFDPDNGLEIKSKKNGHKYSSKFLYWDELATSYKKVIRF